MISNPAADAATADHVIAAARAHFTHVFGSTPSHTALAPGRVNLIGEHTDYNAGFVLPIAIDRVTAAVLGTAPSSSPGIEISSSSLSTSPSQFASFRFTLADLPNAAKWHALRGTPESWSLYAVGTIAGLIHHSPHIANALTAATRNASIRIALASNVPVGGGVSSSAAFETAIARVIEAFAEIELAPAVRAKLCQKGDHEFVGVPCGIMDQFASSAGRAAHAMLIDCRTESCEHVPMPSERDAVVLVADTRIRHENAQGEYPKRVASCKSAATKLAVAHLRDATPAQLEAARDLLTREEFIRARHVITENQRTLAAVESLRAGNLHNFGQLMFQSHESLRLDYEVSCPELDTLVNAAMSMPTDVFGARMTGGGFGGCAIALINPTAATRIATHLRNTFSKTFNTPCGIFITQASAGARAIT